MESQESGDCSRYLRNLFWREGEAGRGEFRAGDEGRGVESSEGKSEGGGGKSISGIPEDF